MRNIGTLAGVVGPAVFVLLFLTEGAIRSGYSPLADYVSALSLGDRGWAQIANFLFVGVCLLLFAYAVAQQLRETAGSRAGPILLAILGFGYLLSGPFIMDPAGTLPTALSWHGLIHGILGAIVFLLMPVTCFVFLRRFGRDPVWHTMWWPTFILGTLVALADITFSVVTKSPNLVATTAPYAGLLQRLVIIPFMIWVAIFALSIAARSRR